MEKIISVKLPKPTSKGVITGHTMAVILNSLVGKITTDLLTKKVKKFEHDKENRELRITFEVEDEKHVAS